MAEPEIRVGIITDGIPEAERQPERTIIRNVLIGEGFHWSERTTGIYEGKFEPLDPPQGNIRTVNTLPLERYLQSVIGSEMNPEAPAEFLKAHAVISRSWALRKILYKEKGATEGMRTEGDCITVWEESDSHTGFDVCSDDHCQRYQGLPEGKQDGGYGADAAIAATRGEVLTDADGRIADARFSKCCGGKTELFSTCWSDRDYPYLPAKEDPWCDLSDMKEEERDSFLDTVLKAYDRTTGFYGWEERVSKAGIGRRLKSRHGVSVGNVTGIIPVKRGPSGRIISLRVVGTEGKVTVGKELAVRRLLSDKCLRSSWFEAEENGRELLLRGRGWGHGAGLCQIGAARMAYEGRNYREILGFYYPGTAISKVYE